MYCVLASTCVPGASPPSDLQQGFQSKLLFKKRMFRETDETITEAQFVNLSYVQAQHDYLQGNYPVVREDASQMCALQIQAEYASTLIDNEEALMQCIEKYITRQVCATVVRVHGVPHTCTVALSWGLCSAGMLALLRAHV